MVKTLDLTGVRFGRLVATHRVTSPSVKAISRSVWLCKCDCGGSVEVVGTSLTSGNTESCGCIGREKTIARNTTHGGSSRPEYISWMAMRSRCNSPTNSKYAYYGGRGIGYHESWNDFQTFLSDMGERPAGATLERKDSNADYGPENCVWASRTSQARNRRITLRLTLKGVTKPLAEWSDLLGIPYYTLKARKMSLKWPDEKSLTTPVRGSKC